MIGADGQRDFDFALLDDLMLLPAGDAAGAIATVAPLRVRALGPIVEYAFQQRAHGDALPPVSQVASSPMTRDLTHVINMQGQFDPGSSTSLDPLGYEFTPLAESSGQPALFWQAFVRRLARAAVKAGFGDSISKGLAGAFGELEDNARVHSDNAPSVIVGYRWSPGEFELVVGDAGIGVLKSLQSHPDYASLTDHGTALQTALTDGESRFGRQAGRGTGFTTVLRRLASLRGTLRFRSGDHSLEMDGLAPSIINANLFQRSYLHGFCISITCRPGNQA